MTNAQQLRQQSYLYIALLSLILTCLLTACGATDTARGQSINNGNDMKYRAPTTPATPTTPEPQVTPTSVSRPTPATPEPTQSYATENGCPNDAVVSNEPAPTIILLPKNTANPVTAHIGDIIEARLPFGQAWTGPVNSQGNLELQSPFGYASSAHQACIWRFVAKGVGTTQLNFEGRPICKPGTLCPLYIIVTTFTIKVI